MNCEYIGVKSPYVPFAKVCNCLCSVHTFASCRKDKLERLALHRVKIYNDSVVRINQAVKLMDRDWLTDSIDHIRAKPGRLYRWKTIPENGCAEFSGFDKTGLATVRFSCAGTYVITADIYDESGMEKLATTIPVTIQVTSKILTPSAAIHRDDTLLIRASPVSSYGPLFEPGVSPTMKRWIQILFRTGNEYEHATTSAFQLESSHSSHRYDLVIKDSLKLSAYPFAHWTGKFSHIDGSINIYDPVIDVPINISVTWLGKKSSGTVTLVNDYYVRLLLDQPGHIRVTN